MADLESELRTHTLSFATAKQVFADRFHWNKTPDSPVYPYVRATTISDVPRYHQQGGGLGTAVVQLDVISDKKEQVNDATQTLFQIFDGYRGVMGEYSVRTFVKNVPSSWEPDSRYFRRILEVEIGYVKQS